MVRRSLPERTVDSWIAVEIAHVFPHARMWSDNWDMASQPGPGKAFVLESKGCDPNPRHADHRVWVDCDQLDRYLRDVQPYVPVLYVLPNPPWAGGPTGSAYLPNEAAFRMTCAEWLWVIGAADLRRHLTCGGHQPRWYPSHLIPGWAESERLDAFLEGIRSCQHQELRIKVLTDSSPTGRGSAKRSGSSTAVFVPEEDLRPAV